MRAGQAPLTARRQACHHQGASARPADDRRSERDALSGSATRSRSAVAPERGAGPSSPVAALLLLLMSPTRASAPASARGRASAPAECDTCSSSNPAATACVGVELDGRGRCRVRFRVRRGNPAPVLGRSWDRSACPSKQSSGCGNDTRTIALDRTIVLVLNSDDRTTVLSTPTKADRDDRPDFQDQSPPLQITDRLVSRQTGRSL